ncbi:hypothetical protein GCM10010452_25760 [Crossiella cryophila]
MSPAAASVRRSCSITGSPVRNCADSAWKSGRATELGRGPGDGGTWTMRIADFAR